MGRETTCAQQVVDGLLLPRSVGGHPALELCNTRAGWGESEPREYLVSYPHLLALASSQRLLRRGEARRLAAGAREQPPVAGRVLAQALRFREDLYAVLTQAPEPPLHRLNDELRRAAAARRIEGTTHHGVSWGFVDQGLRAPLTAFAWQAHLLLTGPLAASVRACPGHGCGWLFADPRGQRRWCVMALCGNRAKARRHAQRQRAAAD